MFKQKWLYSGKVVVFGKNDCNAAKVVVFLENVCIRAKVFVFVQKLLCTGIWRYSGK